MASRLDEPADEVVVDLLDVMLERLEDRVDALEGELGLAEPPPPKLRVVEGGDGA